MARSALIIIDLQNDFLGEDSSFFMVKRQSPLLSAKKTLLSNITDLVKEARKTNNTDIIWIRSVYGECDLSTQSKRVQTQDHKSKNIGEMDDRLCGTHSITTTSSASVSCCIRRSKGAELIPEVLHELVDLEKDLIIEKRWYSSFFQTSLDAILKEKEVSKLFVCGVTTSTCVMATSADARHLNYTVIVCKEGTSATSGKSTVAALDKIANNNWAHVAGKEEILDQIRNDGSLSTTSDGGGVSPQDTNQEEDIKDDGRKRQARSSSKSINFDGLNILTGLGCGDSILIPNFLSCDLADSVFQGVLPNDNASLTERFIDPNTSSKSKSKRRLSMMADTLGINSSPSSLCGISMKSVKSRNKEVEWFELNNIDCSSSKASGSKAGGIKDHPFSRLTAYQVQLNKHGHGPAYRCDDAQPFDSQYATRQGFSPSINLIRLKIMQAIKKGSEYTSDSRGNIEHGFSSEKRASRSSRTKKNGDEGIVAAAAVNEFNWSRILLYRNDSDSMGFHTDKVLDIKEDKGVKSFVASLSLGETRSLVLKPKPKTDGSKKIGKEEDEEEECYTSAPSQTIQLRHNTLFLLGPETNRRFTHSILKGNSSSSSSDSIDSIDHNNIGNPKEIDKEESSKEPYPEVDLYKPRISITFRDLVTFYVPPSKVQGNESCLSFFKNERQFSKSSSCFSVSNSESLDRNSSHRKRQSRSFFDKYSKNPLLTNLLLKVTSFCNVNNHSYPIPSYYGGGCSDTPDFETLIEKSNKGDRSKVMLSFATALLVKHASQHSLMSFLSRKFPTLPLSTTSSNSNINPNFSSLASKVFVSCLCPIVVTSISLGASYFSFFITVNIWHFCNWRSWLYKKMKMKYLFQQINLEPLDPLESRQLLHRDIGLFHSGFVKFCFSELFIASKNWFYKNIMPSFYFPFLKK